MSHPLPLSSLEAHGDVQHLNRYSPSVGDGVGVLVSPLLILQASTLILILDQLPTIVLRRVNRLSQMNTGSDFSSTGRSRQTT